MNNPARATLQQHYEARLLSDLADTRKGCAFWKSGGVAVWSLRS